MIAPTMFIQLADASAAAQDLRNYLAPVINSLCVLATLVCTFFLVNGGIQYMTSNGKVEQLESAKRIIKQAVIGLVIVLAAATLTAILAHAYSQPATHISQNLPALTDIKPDSGGNVFVKVIIDAITGVLNTIIQSVAKPFLMALGQFTNATPLITDNPSVYNLWLAMLGMADVLFVLFVVLIGFHVMSAGTFGLSEIEFKHLLPQIGLVFLLMNSSVVIIDMLIALSNALIHALQSSFGQATVWNVLEDVAKDSGGLGLAALLIMVAFLILSVILLVYYVGRIVTLYIGAVLAPFIVLIGLVPAFRDFSITATKAYVTTIFVLFVHVVILELAASLFTGMTATSLSQKPDPLMAMIVGLATLVALLKTQGVMMQFSYVSLGPRTARKLGGQFMNGVSHLSSGRAAAGQAMASKVDTFGGRPVQQPTGSRRRISAVGQAGSSAVNRGRQTNKSAGGTTVITASSRSQGKTGTTTLAPGSKKRNEMEKP